MNCGDIVLIDHHTTDMHSLKVRPALVVSSDEFNKREPDRILLPLTSNIKRICPDDILIKDNEKIFNVTGLKVSSAIRAGKIFTADICLIKRKLGHLPNKKMAEVRNQIKKILHLR